MSKKIEIFKGGRAGGKTNIVLQELENNLNFLCPNDSERIIQLLKGNTTEYETLQFLNNIVNAAALGADFSKCKDLEEIRKECWRAYVNKLF